MKRLKQAIILFFTIGIISSCETNDLFKVVKGAKELESLIITESPQGLTATPVSPSMIHLSWTATDKATEYVVYRDLLENGTFVTLIYQGSDEFCSDINLSAGRTYYYKAAASNDYSESPFSPVVSAMTPAPPPAEPTGISAVGVTSSSIEVSWNISAGADNYRLYRDTNPGGTFSALVFDGSGTIFLDEGLMPYTTYYYTVRAINTYGASPSSSVVSATTSVAPTGDSFIDLAWGGIKLLEGSLSIAPIYGSNTDNQLPVGQIVIYKTTMGLFGKFRVKLFQPGVSNDLYIEWVTYFIDGSVYSSGSNLLIRGTWSCDLDAGIEVVSDPSQDFFWNQQTSSERYIQPQNGAILSLYMP